jgi:hypothetical protein
MITSFTNEEYKFKTAEAARAFCRVHPECFTATAGDSGYYAMRGFGVSTEAKCLAHYTATGVIASSVPESAVTQLEHKINECKLSYKNIITAGLLGSLTGTKYKMGTECMSHPVIFTYALGVAAPLLTMWFLLSMLLGITAGIVPWYSLLLFGFVYFIVEFIIPWINSYSVDPIEEPWLIPKWLDDNGISR